MPRSPRVLEGVRLGALCLGIAGVLLVLYPVIRPFSDETSLQGAAAFASGAWVLAHVLAMPGFVLVNLGLLSLHLLLRESQTEGFAAVALVANLVGAGLVLPYYGAETFGLHAIGQGALRQHSPALVSLAHDIRYSMPELMMFAVGLLLLAVGGVLVAAAIWRSGTLARWSGVPFALGFALYLPQFSAASRFESVTAPWWPPAASGWRPSCGRREA